MVSIIIAAHNEAAVLDTTLAALLQGPEPPQVVVVPNGCTDDTAAVARAHPGVEVVELAGGGKAAALNAGEQFARSFPRIYLDADIVLPADAVASLSAALDSDGVLVAVPGRRLVSTGRPWPVRAWASIQRRLPVFSQGLFGRGAVAVSAQGRARFDEFPLMVADDLFLDSLFTDEEKAHVDDVVVSVEAPATTSELVARLTRVRRGSAAMRAAGADGSLGIRVRPADRLAWLREVVAPQPTLLPAGLVYAALTLVAAVRARLQDRSSVAWEQTRRSEGRS